MAPAQLPVLVLPRSEHLLNSHIKKNKKKNTDLVLVQQQSAERKEEIKTKKQAKRLRIQRSESIFH
jgi:hypothetical protein